MKSTPERERFGLADQSLMSPQEQLLDENGNSRFTASSFEFKGSPVAYRLQDRKRSFLKQYQQ
jgi:hypothetical protein